MLLIIVNLNKNAQKIFTKLNLILKLKKIFAIKMEFGKINNNANVFTAITATHVPTQTNVIF